MLDKSSFGNIPLDYIKASFNIELASDELAVVYFLFASDCAINAQN